MSGMNEKTLNFIGDKIDALEAKNDILQIAISSLLSEMPEEAKSGIKTKFINEVNALNTNVRASTTKAANVRHSVYASILKAL